MLFTPPARSAFRERANDFQHAIDDGLDRLIGGFDVDGVGCSCQRRIGTRRVAAVALGQCRGDVTDDAGSGGGVRRIARPPLRTFLWRCIEVDLHVGVRKNDGADVPALHHDSARCSHQTLLGDEHAANRGQARHFSRRAIDFRRADRARDVLSIDDHAILVKIETDAFAKSRDRRLVVHIKTLANGHQGDGAIHRPGVDVAIAQFCRNGAGDRSLAGSGRAVDGDDQRIHAAAPYIIPSMRWSRKIALVAAAAVIVIAGVIAADDYICAAEFVIRASDMHGIARRIADFRMQPVQDERLTVSWRGGELPARRYRPLLPSARPILLVPGVHAAGVDEPRLDGFARNLAALGHPVVAVGLPDLARYRITPQTTDMIEDAGRWLGTQANGRPASESIGIVGISFGGGLSIVAASRLTNVAWVLSFGGHGDLPRTLRYLCTGIQPDGLHRPPHDYGVVIILLGAADRLVPADQAEPLRAAILTFLEASHVDMIDKPRAAGIFERARTMAAALDEPARTLMTYVNTRDVAHLGPVLLPHVAEMDDPALSPEKSAPPRGTVYLLHGADDNVIPAVESALLAEDLRRRGGRAYQLATPLITHAEVDRTPTAIEVWHLVRFWAGPL